MSADTVGFNPFDLAAAMKNRLRDSTLLFRIYDLCAKICCCVLQPLLIVDGVITFSLF